MIRLQTLNWAKAWKHESQAHPDDTLSKSFFFPLLRLSLKSLKRFKAKII